jgi:hypothetical protein
MRKIPLDEALMALGPTFTQEVRNRTAAVRDRFFDISPDPEHPQDGLYAAPPYLADPEFRRITTELAELAVNRGIDVNLAIEPNGTTLLHEFVLLRDSKLAVEAVTWLLARGADPNLKRDNGETPLSLALKFDRGEIVELFRHSGRQ